MGRKEQRLAQANRYARYNDKTDRRESFVALAAMLWADLTFLDKAINILIDMSNDGNLIDIHNHEEFEKSFRKAMGE